MTIPLQLSLGGVVTLRSISLSLGKASVAPGVELDATAAVNASIGPVGATLSGVGFSLSVTSVDDSSAPGNLGHADFEFGFKAPDGVGLGGRCRRGERRRIPEARRFDA